MTTNPPFVSAADLFKEGVALARSGKKKDARWMIQQSVLLEPKNEAAWLYLAGIADNLQDAMDAIELVETINPANPHLDKAKTWARERWAKPANTASDKRSPSRLGGRYTRGLLISALILAGLVTLVLGFFYQDVTANFASTLSSATSTFTSAKYLTLARRQLESARAASNQPAMIAALETMRSLDPNNAETGTELAQLYYEQGLSLRDSGNFLEAKNYFARALQAQPDFEPAQTEIRLVDLYLSGVNHHQQAEWAQSVADFELVYKANPDYPYLNEILYSAYFNLGLVRTHENEPAEALKAYQRAVEILPDAPQAPKKVAELNRQLHPPTATPKPTAAPTPVAPPQKRIVVDISEQRCYVYEDDKEIHNFIISTGEPGRDTAVGQFEVLDKIPMAYASTWNLDMPYWLGIYWSGPLQNGFHALPTVRQTGYTLWDGYLGQRVSYGCIILSLKDAETLYNWADVGTPVTIQW